MKISKAQLEVWRARDELDRTLSGMTPKEVQEYAAGVQERVSQFLRAQAKRSRKRPRGQKTPLP